MNVANRRSMSQIENDLKEIRSELGTTISALQIKLSPGALKGEVKTRVREITSRGSSTIRQKALIHAQENRYRYAGVLGGAGVLLAQGFIRRGVEDMWNENRSKRFIRRRFGRKKANRIPAFLYSHPYLVTSIGVGIGFLTAGVMVFAKRRREDSTIPRDHEIQHIDEVPRAQSLSI